MMKVSLIFCALISAIVLVHGEKARFDNYRLIAASVKNDQQRELLQQLEISSDSIQFLDSPLLSKNSIDLIVPPHKFADIEELFESNGIESLIKENNVQR